MSGQDDNFEESQKSGTNRHDSYLDLGKYEYISEIDEEIEKLQQDIEIRRRARQRLGITEDNEAILVIDEKIKLLNTEKKKKRPKERFVNWFTGICLFVIFGIPIFMIAPVLVIVPIAVVFIIISRKVLPKKNVAISVERSKSDRERTVDK